MDAQEKKNTIIKQVMVFVMLQKCKKTNDKRICISWFTKLIKNMGLIISKFKGLKKLFQFDGFNLF